MRSVAASQLRRIAQRDLPSNGGWTYTVLHEFSDEAGGDYPMGGVAIDAQGNLYGTAQGGYYGYGVLWEITP